MDFSGFDLGIKHHGHQLFFLDLTLPYTIQQVIEAMQQENWKKFSETNTCDLDIWPQRYKLLKAKTQVLKHVQAYINQDSTKWKVIQALYSHSPNVRIIYGMTPEQMYDNTVLHGEFSLDKPGFECGRHIDFRLLAATGGIYFNEGDNADAATHFYRTVDGPTWTRAETGFGKGWMQLNDIDVWHDGWNRTDQDRYSMLIALTIQTKHPLH